MAASLGRRAQYHILESNSAQYQHVIGSGDNRTVFDLNILRESWKLAKYDERKKFLKDLEEPLGMARATGLNIKSCDIYSYKC
ncbi:hypothetical protein BGZ60DRAFT_414285 [Tricladium varicosporioides]|nr:hypothetical protein BGZ60DRAFT_414285 [Hymenoscyphus varicosporioides]